MLASSCCILLLYCWVAPTLECVCVFIVQNRFEEIHIHSDELLGCVLFCTLYLDSRYKLKHTLNEQVPEDFQLPVCDASFQRLQVVIVQICVRQLKEKQL